MMELNTENNNQILSETNTVNSYSQNISNNKPLYNDDINLRKKAKKRERSPTLTNSDTSKSIPTTSNAQPSSPNSNQNNVTTNANNTNKKEKQRPETWNKIEQQIFFNALRQNGKNFESITQYFNARQKKYIKGDDGNGGGSQRSKEQIRHFYYRTWHKIIKYVSLPMLVTNLKDCDVNIVETKNDKAINNRDLQVKCLIAYNCLMNKSQRWNKKTSIKLVELINHGWTTVREKGKITRLRMPICKVSSKTVTKEEVDTSNQLPSTINIQLEPKTESAFGRVHRLAQNPFLNIEISTLQSIRYLIEFLENKWKNRREQFIEKFQKDSTTNSKLQKTSEIEQNDNNFNNKKMEKLILFPNENHQLSNIELIEASSTQQQTQIELIHENQLEINKINPTNVVELKRSENDCDPDFLLDNLDQKTIETNKNEIMMMDDCAIIPDNFPLSNNNNNNKNSSCNLNNTSNNKKLNDNKIRFKLNADQLKSGLTCLNSTLTSQNNSKELTIIQLYLALNKPNVIKLKYDWIITNNHNSNLDFYTLQQSQNQRQRFYMETLSNVAASFLNELTNQKPNNLSTNSNTVNSSMNSSTKQVLHNNNNNINLSQNSLVTNKSNKSPQKPLQQLSRISDQSIAIIQPNSSTATIIPVETVLKRINEEQTNKTKILLSDLNTKRRSRTRKPIMVVNSGHYPPRNVLPKITLPNGQFLKPMNMENISNPIQIQTNITTNNINNNNLNSPISINSPSSSSSSNQNNQTEPTQQQNIVVSCPVAAVPRQIVNTNSNLPSNNNNTNNNNNNVQPIIIQNNVNNNKVLIQSFHQYSNLIPQILNNLNENEIQINEKNRSNNSNNHNAVVLVDENNFNNQNTNNNINNPGSPHGLTNMSLLELSINNNDSFFATASNNNNNNMQKEKSNNVLINNTDSISLGGLFSNIDSLLKTKSNSTNNNSNNNINNFSDVLQDNSSMSSLSSFLNSLNCNKSNQGDASNSKQIGLIATTTPVSSSKLFGSSSNINGINSSSSNLAQKKSELIVEWTDSMNDVSLTGCYLTDLQSPEKSQKSTLNGGMVNILNENSRDSIFFNMDTMDILLPTQQASANEAK